MVHEVKRSASEVKWYIMLFLPQGPRPAPALSQLEDECENAGRESQTRQWAVGSDNDNDSLTVWCRCRLQTSHTLQ